MQKTRLFRRIPLFSCLSEEEWAILSQIALEKHYPKNMIIISQGDDSSSLYVILGGRAQALSIDESGRQIVLNEFGPGDYFGEMSFLDESPRCATVLTKTAAHMLKFSRERFQDILAANPAICFNLLMGLNQKLRKATAQIEDLVFRDVYGRVSRVLTQDARPKGEAYRVTEKMTHQEIADHVGSSREMVSRIMKALSQGGFISVHKHEIRILKGLPYSW